MLTLIALSAALMQQPTAPPAPPEIRTRVMVLGGEGPGGLDKDGDGQITREEFAAPMNDHFARMDSNNDGRLSTEELAADHGTAIGGEPNVMIMRGPGGHGAGSQPEVRIMRGPGAHGGSGMPHIELRRLGGEGGTHAGSGEARTTVFISGPSGAGGEGRVVILGPGSSGGFSTAAYADGGPGERIEIRRVGGPGGEGGLDADNDGKISEAEFTSPLREAFGRMDADQSGFIEQGERGSHGEAHVMVRRTPGEGHD